MSRSEQESRNILKAMEELQEYNLRLNKSKCEILDLKKKENEAQVIEGVEVRDSVRYLGV